MLDENPREIASRVLQKHLRGTDYVENIFEFQTRDVHLPPVDRSLCQELVYGVVRWQRTLDHLISLKARNEQQAGPIQVFARMGLYQMFWLDRIPDHAAVNETVELCKRAGFDWQAGFLNALLRGYAREKEQTKAMIEELKVKEPALGYSHPAWIYERWKRIWGDQSARELMAWNNTPAKTFARLNTLRMTPDNLREQWANERVEARMVSYPWLGPVVFYELTKHPSIAGMNTFRGGGFYVQDPSTVLAVSLLSPQRSDRILDTCAAPGGKATLMAQLVENEGLIIARDTEESRMRQLRENCARLGAKCIEVEKVPALGGTHRFSYDRALADVPCSNTGVFRRRLDARWKLRSEELTRLVRDQNAILADAARGVKTGGTLVYSTCSIEPEENRGVVDTFLAAHPGWVLETEKQLLPFREGVDGAYAAKLNRR